MLTKDFNKGLPLPLVDLYEWIKSCNGTLKLKEGTYCFPKNFQYNFDKLDVTITGITGKTVITTYDNTPSTNFAIPLKVNISELQANGIYQDEYSLKYFKFDNGVKNEISLKEVKNLGYVTELDTTKADPEIDGIYVVTKHSLYSYGGGAIHLNLYGTYNTNGKNVMYTQGTVLVREKGIWSRHFTGAGFITKSNLVVKGVIFDNVQFYILSPFDINAKDYLSSYLFELNNCKFKNCARILSTCTYGGIDMEPNWFKATTYYSTNGILRFENFKITNCDFSSIHTAIAWNCPPSLNTVITKNTIHDCHTLYTCFNFFITYYDYPDHFKNIVTQTISYNTFKNIRPIDNNSQTSLIRTSGMATVMYNTFTNVSPQICFLSGGKSTFRNNIVDKFVNPNEPYSPVILIKGSISTNTITKNTINTPFSTLVALEGQSPVVISFNEFKGLTRYRSIDKNSTFIFKNLIYQIKDLNRFQELSQRFSSTITEKDFVYYNILNFSWEKIYINFLGFVFSKNDDSPGQNQTLRINDNYIESEGIINIGSKTPVEFKSVNIYNNEIHNAFYLRTGNTLIQDFIFSNNKLNSELSTSVTNVLKSSIRNNTIL